MMNQLHNWNCCTIKPPGSDWFGGDFTGKSCFISPRHNHNFDEDETMFKVHPATLEWKNFSPLERALSRQPLDKSTGCLPEDF